MLTLVAIFAIMLLADARLTLVALLPLPILSFWTVRFGLTQRVISKAVQAQMGVVSTVQENLTGVRVVKAFAREDYEIGKFNGENQEYLKRRL